MLKNILLFFIFTQFLEQTRIERNINMPQKKVEECIHKILNKSDPTFKFRTDMTQIHKAILQFPLMNNELQEKLQSCLANNEQKTQCEEKYGTNQCEECGMIFVKKCQTNQIRIDCGICAYICPEETISTYKQTICLKPKVYQRKMYQSEFACLDKITSEQDCSKKEKLWIESCPQNYRPLGQYLCDYKCPSNQFDDTNDSCIPKLTITNEYFSSSLTDSYGQKSIEM